jgi:hypothetical protein
MKSANHYGSIARSRDLIRLFFTFGMRGDALLEALAQPVGRGLADRRRVVGVILTAAPSLRYGLSTAWHLGRAAVVHIIGLAAQAPIRGSRLSSNVRRHRSNQW